MANSYANIWTYEISDANIRTRVAGAKKVAISGRLMTIWGLCRLGRRYWKSENAILRGIKFRTTQYQNLRQNIATVPGICFILVTIAPNLVPFWTIYPLKLMFSAISASCVTTWIGQTPSFGIRITIITVQTINAINKKQKNAKIMGQNEQRVRIRVTRCFMSGI